MCVREVSTWKEGVTCVSSRNRDVMFHENVFPYAICKYTMNEKEEESHQVDCAYFDGVQDKRVKTKHVEHLGTGQYQPKPLILLRDYVTYTTKCSKDSTCTQTHSKSSSSCTTPYPIANYVISVKNFPRYHALLDATTVGDEPISFSIAMKDDDGEKK
ncbi:hypothetical protein CR513_25772, partial [Mucuna pruriens]